MSTVYPQSTVATLAPNATSRFVGRYHELRVLRRQYEEVRNGRAAVVLVVGEQGIGKSRLLQEFSQWAWQDGATVLGGGASEAEGMPPYLPFLEALGRYIQQAPLDQLREQVQPATQILMNILPELATRLGELPAPLPLPPEQVRLRLYEAVGTFIEKMSAPHALVLTLDDLHFADSASLDLLCHVVRSHSGARLLVLGIYREDEIERNPALERTLTKLVQQRILTSIAMEALSAKEIEALAESYLGGPVSPTVTQLLLIQSEGNPFFAEELINSWIEKGSIVREHEQWIAAARSNMRFHRASSLSCASDSRGSHQPSSIACASLRSSAAHSISPCWQPSKTRRPRFSRRTSLKLWARD